VVYFLRTLAAELTGLFALRADKTDTLFKAMIHAIAEIMDSR
jgi:hypothetical protein